VVSFSVAVEKGFGEKKSTSWFNCVAFKDVAEFAEKYLKKGKGVLVTGDLQARSWEDKATGAKRTTTEIIAYKIDFLDTGSRSGDQPARQERAAPAPRQQATPQPRATTAPEEEDPFGENDPF
jgi:single-strand DNA-binding protein